MQSPSISSGDKFVGGASQRAKPDVRGPAFHVRFGSRSGGAVAEHWPCDGGDHADGLRPQLCGREEFDLCIWGSGASECDLEKLANAGGAVADGSDSRGVSSVCDDEWDRSDVELRQVLVTDCSSGVFSGA